MIEAIRKLIDGGDTHATVLAIALTAGAIVLMPLLGAAKLRLGKQLDPGATTGEGIQNLMCAVRATTALIAVAAAGIGLGVLDPIAARRAASRTGAFKLGSWVEQPRPVGVGLVPRPTTAPPR